MSTSPGPQGGVIQWFARNSVAANLLMWGLLIGGLLMLSRTNTEIFPQIDPRQITVSVEYPGATPSEVEESITRRVEDAVLGLEGVDRVSSSAKESSGTVTIELTDFAEASEVKDDVQSAIDELSDFPPEEAEAPKVSVTTSVSRVMRVVVSGEVGERSLRQAGERLERDLLATDGISIVTLQGVRKYEISIEVSPDRLREFDLSIDDIANAIRNASVNLSAGTLRTVSGDVLLRTDAEARDAASFGNIVILRDDEGRRVYLRDVANILDGFDERPLVNTYNGLPAVFLKIDRSDNEDAFAVSDAVKDFLREYKPPPGVAVQIASDETETINDRINLLARNAMLGLALVFFLLALTLDLRLAWWTCVGIPIAFLGGFIFFGQFTTINMVTLFGLIMVLGIVVDDAIVVGENIYELQREGVEPSSAAVRGASKVFVPVLVGVLTSMFVFAPLLYSTGILGQILRPVPLVVIAVLFVSLLEVFLILPAHLVHGGSWSVGPMRQLKEAVEDGLFWVRDRLFLPLVCACVRYPAVTIASGVAVFIMCLGLLSGGHVRFIFFPVVESEEISFSLEMQAGTPFEQTQEMMDRVVAAAYQAVGGKDSSLYKSLSVTVGGSLTSGFGASGTTIRSEAANAKLELIPSSERDLSAANIERRWRDGVGPLIGVKSMSFQSAGISGGEDIRYDLSHFDGEKLETAVSDLISRLENVEGVNEIKSSAEPGKREMKFSLTPTGVAAGLTENDLARTIRSTYFGEEVQRMQRNGEEVPVYVRFPEEQRRSLRDLVQLHVPLPEGGVASLPSVAQVTESRSFATIDRVDGRRIISVTADVDESLITPNEVGAIIEREMLPELYEQHPELKVTQEGLARSQSEDSGSLGVNLLIAILAMYALLASVLRSYIQPLFILSVIPFGFVGAVLGHLFMGFDLTFLSIFGVVALAGVIVNDSIVLIDYYNDLQAKVDDRVGNIVLAVERRFRPILLTTLTTFVGLMPMIAETSVQAKFLIPMAISIAFGIVFASFMTLCLVPALIAFRVRN